MRRKLRYLKYKRRAYILAWVSRFGGYDLMVKYGDARGWISEADGKDIVLRETPSFTLLRRKA